MTDLPVITPEQVRAVNPNIPPSVDLQPSIAVATMLVKNAVVDSGCGSAYSEDQLAQIIVWLAAHFYAIQYGVLSGRSVGKVSESYDLHNDIMLAGTPFGQTAMLLDPNKCLAQLMADTKGILEGKNQFGPVIKSASLWNKRGSWRPR